MDDMPFGLSPQSHAKLSREDLQSMGKQAAVAYLQGGTSLNEAVIKLAQVHPSISPHQVRRVVEFANQETFSRMFSDGEKYANDKNIEFPVADPGVVLKSLDISARPSVIEGSPEEYGCEPVKTAHAGVEADLALAWEFGVDLASPGAERTSLIEMEKKAGANDLVITRIMEIGKDKEADGAVADRIMMAGDEGIMPDSAAALSTDQVPDVARQESEEEQATKEAMGPMMLDAGADENPDVGNEQAQHPEITHRENMRAMERRVELEKKKQELVAMQAKQTQAAGDMGGAPSPTPGDEGGAPPPGGPPPGGPPPAEMGPPPPAGGMPPEGGAPMGPEAGMMPPPGPPPGPPAGLPGGGPFPMKKAAVEQALELTKQAMVYAKSDRPRAKEVLDDLAATTSLDRIKEATAGCGQYPEANPFGELIRTKEKLGRILDDMSHTRDKNEFLQKEARDSFFHEVTQYMFGGGNLGEVTHSLQSVASDEGVIKVAMDHLIPHLVSKGLNVGQARANMITYEMEKGASARVVNPKNPIVESFSALCKVAQKQRELEQAVEDVRGYYGQVEKLLSEASARDARSA